MSGQVERSAMLRSFALKEFALLDEVPMPIAVTRGPQHLIHFTNAAWRGAGLAMAGAGLVRLRDVVSLEAAIAVGDLADETYRSGRERRSSVLTPWSLPCRWRCGGRSALADRLPRQ